VVVVRFSRTRGRYERQGILVEPDAIEKAEGECAGDAEQRAAARAQGAARRLKEDRQLTARMAQQIAELFPRCPPEQAAAIARHTARRGSGRVGRSAAGRNLEPRHNHTRYDGLLREGVDRDDARRQVARQVEEILASWRE
jgi:hypothetical protein